MPEEFGTRDVLEQVDTRLTNVEQDVRGLRTDMRSEFADVRTEMREEFVNVRAEMREGFAAQTADTSQLRGDVYALRSEMNARFESNARWVAGMIFASWISVMASLWLKP
jgi:hypothetical protein